MGPADFVLGPNRGCLAYSAVSKETITWESAWDVGLLTVLMGSGQAKYRAYQVLWVASAGSVCDFSILTGCCSAYVLRQIAEKIRTDGDPLLCLTRFRVSTYFVDQNKNVDFRLSYLICFIFVKDIIYEKYTYKTNITDYSIIHKMKLYGNHDWKRNLSWQLKKNKNSSESRLAENWKKTLKSKPPV